MRLLPKVSFAFCLLPITAVLARGAATCGARFQLWTDSGQIVPSRLTELEPQRPTTRTGTVKGSSATNYECGRYRYTLESASGVLRGHIALSLPAEVVNLLAPSPRAQDVRELHIAGNVGRTQPDCWIRFLPAIGAQPPSSTRHRIPPAFAVLADGRFQAAVPRPGDYLLLRGCGEQIRSLGRLRIEPGGVHWEPGKWRLDYEISTSKAGPATTCELRLQPFGFHPLQPRLILDRVTPVDPGQATAIQVSGSNLRAPCGDYDVHLTSTLPDSRNHTFRISLRASHQVFHVDIRRFAHSAEKYSPSTTAGIIQGWVPSRQDCWIRLVDAYFSTEADDSAAAIDNSGQFEIGVPNAGRSLALCYCGGDLVHAEPASVTEAGRVILNAARLRLQMAND